MSLKIGWQGEGMLASKLGKKMLKVVYKRILIPNLPSPPSPLGTQMFMKDKQADNKSESNLPTVPGTTQ